MRNRKRVVAPCARLQMEHLEDRLTPATAFALSGTTLLAFDTANPTATVSTPITGLNMGDVIVGMDVRPQNGHLYGLGFNSTLGTVQLYNISARTGVATAVGSTGSFVDAGGNPVLVSGTGFGVDFNPTVDRVRVVTNTGQNFRIDPNTGAFIDGNLGGMPNSIPGLNMDGPINIAGSPATVDAAAYTNNAPNVTVTTQYVLDAATNQLRIQNPPNGGTQVNIIAVTLNGTPLDFDAVGGFDIPSGVTAATSGTPVTTGSAFAVLTVGGSTGMYSIDLVTGAATLVGTVGDGTTPVSGLAIQNDLVGTPSVGLNALGTQLVRFNTATPGTSMSATITGITAGETLVAVDFRPQTGQFYGLGINPVTDTGTLYLIDPQTGAASAVGTPGQIAFVDDMGNPVDLPDLSTAGYGMDFNPTVDRIRVVTSSGLNFRVDPITGAPVDGNLNNTMTPPAGINTDGPINGLPVGSTGVSATAYTNSFGQSLTGGVTTQYTLDAASNMLFIQNPPNAGTQVMGKMVTLNGAPLDFTDVTGFDIPAGVRVTASGTVATGFGVAALTVGGVSNLYRIDLATGAATLIGAAPMALSGFATADAPAGSVSVISGPTTVAEGKNAVFTFARTGGTSGPLTVTVTASGTATVGSDIPMGPFTVTFADGQSTATLTIPISADAAKEPIESLVLTVTSVSNAGVIGAQDTATMNIADAEQRMFGAIISSSGSPTVTVLNPDNSLLGTFQPFGGGVTGVRSALGDFTGDGVADVVFTPMSGAPIMRFFDGATGAFLADIAAFDAAFGSASMALGDFNGDGRSDILVGSSVGGLVRAFSGADGSLLASFQPFAGYNGPVSVAAGDIDGDGRAEAVYGMRAGTGRTIVFNPVQGVVADFLAFGGGTGVEVTLGDVDGDGRADLIMGTQSGPSRVRVVTAALQETLLAPPSGGTSAVRVAALDVTGDGVPDLLAGFAASGLLDVFTGPNLAFLGTAGFATSGTFVG